MSSGASTLSLPIRFIQQLGLAKRYEKRVISSLGQSGLITLEMMDLVVDVGGRQLTGKPAHGGEHVLELY